MNKNGSFSLWLGSGTDKERFDAMLEYSINDSGLGKFVPCRFCKEFGIEQYDPDRFGGKFFAREIRLGLLLKDHGLSEEVIKKLDAQNSIKPNCTVALYDYEYTGDAEKQIDGFQFWFAGTFPY